MSATSDMAADDAVEGPSGPGLFGRLWQKRLVTALVFGGTLFAVIGLLLLMPVSYVASGSLIATDREASADSARSDAATDVESAVVLLRSPRLLRTLLGQPAGAAALEADCVAVSRQLLNRLHPPDCSRLTEDADAAVQWVSDRLVVFAVGRSRVVSVGYRSPSPSVAQAMANDLIQTFLAGERDKLRHSRDEAIEWVRQRLAQFDAQTQADAAALDAFRSEHGLARASGGPSPVTEARAALADAEARLAEARTAVSARPAADTKAVADLRQQLSQATAVANGAAQRLGSQNPALLAYRKQEADLAARLAAESGRASEAGRSAARRTLDAARARVDDATRDLARQTEAADRTAEAEAQSVSMSRDLALKRDASADLSRRLSRLETERLALEPGVQLVNLAELPQRPAFPPRVPFLIGGLVLAAALATTAGLMTYRPVVSGPLALGRTYTRVPILTQIPGMRLRQTGRKPPGDAGAFPLLAAVSLMETHPPLLEALRVLHARLTLAGFGDRSRTLMIASEIAGEGKSFVTLALARMARASGRRVLVIETCLRQPLFEEALHGPPSAGLAGFLRGGPPEVISLGAVPGVDFMLAGDTMGDSTELLSGPRFRQLLEWAASYDLVLIDSAAVSDLMDAALIAPQVDGVVFCLRAGRPPASHALSSLPEVQRTSGNVVGIALTFVPDDQITQPGVAQTRRIQPQRQLQAGDAY